MHPGSCTGGAPFVLRGLRLLPWLQDEHRKNPEGVSKYFFDCERCMREQTEQTRQDMGCGYLPASPTAFPSPLGGRVECIDERDLETGRLHLPVCAGYVCALPEVIEASNAYLFFKNGGLLQYTQGEPPTEYLLAAMSTLESESDKLIAKLSKDAESKR